MVSRKRFLMFWVGGLIAFVVALALHMPLTLETVSEGIVDHQTATTAARVDFIQGEWAEAGVYRTALTAMISDLVFIMLFSVGSFLGGLYFLRVGTGALRTIGLATVFAAIVFFLSDSVETTLQIQQLAAGAGDDTKAAIAAAMHYPKLVSWIACFILPLNGLILEWSQRRAA
ncbi:hypothetical protein [Erythrobacter litoralis]|uniref:DUF4386 domain-containing protein n=1 Tax=Erythrobacter litoralis (strain HTCC2594) TaxID=314225 RepID=Q2N9R7_ERYLH|nr:hypothetical protein [Erythrobacter litoralis]ABC63574.1 hypothetical protein ELI_07410 [Erythrobacter litoralis HTCC2594]